MTESNPIRSSDTSLTRDILDIARHYLRGWRGITVLASVAIAAGLAFNWGWLVAVGIAPILLAVLPCVAMCALGLCMNRMGGRSCSTDASAPTTARGSGVDETPTPTREIPPVTSAAASASDPQAAFIEATMANRESKPQRERRLTDA
jgi:hypothetical protein